MKNCHTKAISRFCYWSVYEAWRSSSEKGPAMFSFKTRKVRQIGFGKTAHQWRGLQLNDCYRFKRKDKSDLYLFELWWEYITSVIFDLLCSWNCVMHLFMYFCVRYKLSLSLIHTGDVDSLFFLTVNFQAFFLLATEVILRKYDKLCITKDNECDQFTCAAMCYMSLPMIKVLYFGEEMSWPDRVCFH